MSQRKRRVIRARLSEALSPRYLSAFARDLGGPDAPPVTGGSSAPAMTRFLFLLLRVLLGSAWKYNSVNGWGFDAGPLDNAAPSFACDESRGAMTLRRLLRPARTHPGLLAGCAAGFLCAWILPGGAPALVRAVLAWDATVLVFLVLTWTVMLRGGHQTMRYRAAHYDASDSVLLLVCVVAVIASLVAITGMVVGIGNMPTERKILRLVLSVVTVVGSWLFLHTVLALHYAHQYYWPRRLAGHPETHHGGLEFPGDEAPDYLDFMYFSFVLGACSQTSDVAITSKTIRRLATLHGTLAFAFNTLLLALTVNIAASLL
jgi:uncharacterized membrane protein